MRWLMYPIRQHFYKRGLLPFVLLEKNFCGSCNLGRVAGYAVRVLGAGRGYVCAGSLGLIVPLIVWRAGCRWRAGWRAVCLALCVCVVPCVFVLCVCVVCRWQSVGGRGWLCVCVWLGIAGAGCNRAVCLFWGCLCLVAVSGCEWLGWAVSVCEWL